MGASTSKKYDNYFDRVISMTKTGGDDSLDNLDYDELGYFGGSKDTSAVMSFTTFLRTMSGTRCALSAARSPLYPVVTNGRAMNWVDPPLGRKSERTL